MTSSNQITELDKTFTKIIENFNCSICLEEFKDTFITIKCAHRFCKKCIKQSIKVHHKCPLCNHYLTKDDIVRDAIFDNLKNDIEIFKRQKMDSLLTKLSKNFEDNDNENPNHNQFSKLEIVFKDHLINSLRVHRNYVKQLKNHFDNEVIRIKEGLGLEQILGKTNLDLISIEQQIQISILENEYNKQINLIAKKYDKYLKDSKMTPLSLPVKLRIKIMSKKIQINKDFEFQSNDSIDKIYEFIGNYTEEQNDKVIGYGEDLLILCIGPFSNVSFAGASAIYEKYLKNTTIVNQLSNDIEIIRTKDCYPILEYSIKPNSELIFFGNIKFESDLPKHCINKKISLNIEIYPNECIKYKNFYIMKHKRVDYFSCETCNVIRICESCQEICHKNHKIKWYTLIENAEYAYCHCDLGKKKCSLKPNSGLGNKILHPLVEAASRVTSSSRSIEASVLEA